MGGRTLSVTRLLISTLSSSNLSFAIFDSYNKQLQAQLSSLVSNEMTLDAQLLLLRLLRRRMRDKGGGKDLVGSTRLGVWCRWLV